jgi:hypothetical protein
MMRVMTQDKKEISDRERERRARQAAEQQAKNLDPKSGAGGSKNPSGGYHPSTLVPRHQKKTGRGT